MTNIGGPDSFGSVAGLLTPVRVCHCYQPASLYICFSGAHSLFSHSDSCIAASSLAGWVIWSVLCVCLFGFCVFAGKITQTPLSQISWRWRDAARSKEESVEFWSWSVLHKLYKKGTGIGGTWNRNLSVVCRFTVSVSVWVTGTLTLLLFLFQRWSVPSRCQPWTPRSILGFCLLPRVASLTTSLAWDQCLSPAWLWTEDTHQVLWCHHYTSNRAAAKISLKKLPLLRQQVALWPGGNKRCERKLWCLLSTLSYFHVICLD